MKRSIVTRRLSHLKAACLEISTMDQCHYDPQSRGGLDQGLVKGRGTGDQNMNSEIHLVVLKASSIPQRGYSDSSALCEGDAVRA